MDKFRNKYRIASTRLQNWDYSSPASYFITICTHNRICHFGEIVQDPKNSKSIMQLSEIGEIVKSEWLKTFELRSDMALSMGEFVIMPNHFHAIITIGKNQYNSDIPGGTDAMHRVSTLHRGDAMHRVSIPKFGPQSKNLPSIVRGFKSAVTTAARKMDSEFAWQSRFHDHIIRNDKSFNNISIYIRNNPDNWKIDTQNK